MAGETVGIRVLVSGVAAAVKNLDLVTDAYDRQAAALERLKGASAGASEAATAAQAKSAESAKASAASQVESAGAVAVASESSSKRVTTAEAAAAKAQKDAQAAHDARIRSLVSGAGAIAKWGTALAGGVVYEAVKTYMSTQQLLEQSVTQAGLNQSRLNAMTPGILGISEDTGLSFQSVADQLYRIVSATAGLHLTNQELLQLTDSAAKLAVLGGPGTDPEQIARVFGAVRTSGVRISQGGKAPTPDQIAAWANATVGAGDMRMSDLVAMLGTGVLTSASMYHVSLQSLGAWTDIMSSQAMGGAKIGTLLNHALSLLATPNQTAAEWEALLGFKPGDIADLMRGPGGALAAITALKAAMQKGIVANPDFFTKFYGSGVKGEETLLRAGQFTPAQIAQMMTGGLTQNEQLAFLTRMFGGAKQETPIAMAFLESGLFGSKVAQIKAASTQSRFAYDVGQALDEPANQVAILLQNLHGLGYTIGHDLTPYVIDLLRDLNDVGRFFEQHPAVLKTAMIAGGATLGLSYAIKIGSGISKLLSPFTGGGGVMNQAGVKLIVAADALSAAAERLGVAGKVPGGLGGAASSAENDAGFMSGKLSSTLGVAGLAGLAGYAVGHYLIFRGLPTTGGPGLGGGVGGQVVWPQSLVAQIANQASSAPLFGSTNYGRNVTETSPGVPGYSGPAADAPFPMSAAKFQLEELGASATQAAALLKAAAQGQALTQGAVTQALDAFQVALKAYHGEDSSALMRAAESLIQAGQQMAASVAAAASKYSLDPAVAAQATIRGLADKYARR